MCVSYLKLIKRKCKMMLSVDSAVLIGNFQYWHFFSLQIFNVAKRRDFPVELPVANIENYLDC